MFAEDDDSITTVTNRILLQAIGFKITKERERMNERKKERERERERERVKENA